jgi:hypothetical protein
MKETIKEEENGRGVGEKKNLNKNSKIQQKFGKILGSDGGVFEDDCLTGCCTMWGLDEGSKYL